MSNTKLTKSVIDLFFKEHKDAAAVFVMAGLTTAEIERAIVIIGREEINPGNRKGYEAVARQILKKRQPESAVNNSEQKELPLGISKPNPAVFPIADSDPRVAGVPYQERGVLKVRLVDIDAMLACLEDENRSNAGNDRDAKVSYVYSLNLGKPRLLKSPTKLQLEELQKLEGKFPHFREVIDRIRMSLNSRMLSGAPTKFPNILLTSGPGLGKTLFLQEVGKILEIDTHVIASSSGSTDPLSLIGLARPWRSAAPGKIAHALAIKSNEEKAANCIFFIDEIDKAVMSGRSDNGNTTSFFDQLLNTLESPYSFVDSYFGEKAAIFMGYSSWIFAANDISLIPKYFTSRCEIFEISSPGRSEYLDGLLASVFEKVLASAPYAPFFKPVLSDEVTDLLASSGHTPREIRRALELALERALSRYSEPPEAGSVWLSPDDFSLPVVSQKRSIGFHAEVCK